MARSAETWSSAPATRSTHLDPRRLTDAAAGWTLHRQPGESKQLALHDRGARRTRAAVRLAATRTAPGGRPGRPLGGRHRGAVRPAGRLLAAAKAVGAQWTPHRGSRTVDGVTRPWSLEEDDAIRAACRENRTIGLSDVDGEPRNPRRRARRLQAVADRIGRTLGAVRKRAQRLGERWYRLAADQGHADAQFALGGHVFRRPRRPAGRPRGRALVPPRRRSGPRRRAGQAV